MFDLTDACAKGFNFRAATAPAPRSISPECSRETLGSTAGILRLHIRRRVTAWIFSGLALLGGTAAQAAPFAYITNVASNDVSVVDLASNTVTATVPVGTTPIGVAVNLAGTRVYVANGGTVGAYSVSVIDTATNTVIATVMLPSNPVGVAVNPAGTRVYVTLQFADAVAVIDTASNSIVASTPVSAPFGIVVSPDGAHVYVASLNNFVAVLDPANNTVSGMITVGSGPRGIAINASGSRAYVANLISNNVSVLDTTNNTVVSTVAVGTYPYGVAVSPDGTRVYVTNNGSGDVSVIDATSNTTVGTVTLAFGSSPRGIGVNAAGTKVYVANVESHFGTHTSYLVEIGTGCNEMSGTLSVGTDPAAFGLFIGPGGDPPPGPSPTLTTHVTGIELTQGIQDVANSVPLIIGRRTFARVHVQSDGPAVAGVTARLRGLGAYMSGGGVVEVPLTPIAPSNAGGPRITVRPSPQRSILDDNFLFELPWEWTNFAGLRVFASLSAPDGPPLQSCERDVASAPVNEFRTFTTLEVAYVRMAYQLPGGYAEASSGEQRQSESWLRRTYPVSQLKFTNDFVLFDPFLGSFVDQSNLFCQVAYTPATRNLCAYGYVSSRLSALDATSSFMGTADVAYGLIPQPTPNPTNLFTRGACCTGRAAAGPANDADYSSHEIGHFLGRKHPVQASAECKHSPDDPNYPYFFTFIAPPLSDPNTSLAGFDGGDPNLLLPMGVIPPSMGFDIMGYCQPKTWMSDYTYRALAISLQVLHPDISGVDATSTQRVPAPVPQSGDWLLVFGQIAPDLGIAKIFNIQRTDQIFNQPPRVPGIYSIRLVDMLGATLADYTFAPTVETDANTPGGSSTPELGFGQAVPFVAGTHEVRILDNSNGGAVLASALVSANAPVVANVAVQGMPDPPTGLVTVTWTASDVDNDVLHFDLYLARNNGMTLQPLQVGISANSAQVDTSTLGGGPVQFRVMASDGLQTAYADSPALLLANKPPQSRILLPGASAHVYLGQVVNLQGEAMDPQDGRIADSGLTWSSQLGALGTGTQLSVSDLPVGVNVVTLTAINSASLAATSTTIITVDGDLDSPGPTLTAGPAQIGWQVAAGEMQLQTASLYIGNRGSGTVQFTVSTAAPWLTASAMSGTAPATLTLAANPGGLADGAILDTTLTLTAVGDPAQVITVPVRLSVGDTFDVGNATPPVNDVIFRNGFEASAALVQDSIQ